MVGILSAGVGNFGSPRRAMTDYQRGELWGMMSILAILPVLLGAVLFWFALRGTDPAKMAIVLVAFGLANGMLLYRRRHDWKEPEAQIAERKAIMAEARERRKRK